MMTNATTPSFFETHSRVCVLVLAASKGSRLFPMTSADMPKHLLPIGGVPCILRLVESMSHVPQLVIAVSADDSQTIHVLQTVATLHEGSQSDGDEKRMFTLTMNNSFRTITVVKLSEECFGPVDAIREVEDTNIIHPSTRLCVVPGDLVFLQKNINLDPLLRPSSESQCTILLVDVGEVDEHGAPLKESAKAKKGGLSRDEEDIEYIALSYSSEALNDPTVQPRVVLKQSKLDVEADEDMTGSTAKLEVPKARLRHGRLVVKTCWNDVHVYSFAPWVRQLLTARKGLSSIQEDVLPLLVSRQFRGKKATFGNSLDGDEGDEKKDEAERVEVNDEPYSVAAMVLPSKTILRANTISSYHYAGRETVVNGAILTMPPESKWNGKFQTLVLEGSTLGPKINMKSSIVGNGCELGAKCRLNNVIIMDGVTIGENCSLQNSLIGPGAKLGNNCSLNDCQVGPGKEIPAGTKEKGESFMVGDVMTEDVL